MKRNKIAAGVLALALGFGAVAPVHADDVDPAKSKDLMERMQNQIDKHKKEAEEFDRLLRQAEKDRMEAEKGEGAGSETTKPEEKPSETTKPEEKPSEKPEDKPSEKPEDEDKPSDDKNSEQEKPSDDATSEEEVSDSATVEHENPHDGKLSITTSNVVIGKPNEEGVRKIEKVDKLVKDAEENEVPNYSVMYFIDNVGEIDEDGMADVELSVIYGDALAGKIKVRAKVLGTEQEKPEDKPSEDKKDDDKKDKADDEEIKKGPYDTKEEATEAAKKALKAAPTMNEYVVYKDAADKFFFYLRNNSTDGEGKVEEDGNEVVATGKKDDSKESSSPARQADNNAKTGVTGLVSVASILGAASVAYVASKKRD